MRKSICFLMSIILFFACNDEPLPEVLSTFILQNKTSDNVIITLYSHDTKDTVIQLNTNDSCQFNYVSIRGPFPYRMPLDEYDSIDIEKETDIKRYLYKDHTGPFNLKNYVSIDTTVDKKKKKCELYKYTFFYYID